MNARPGRPPRLSADAIVVAAVGLVDAEGLEQLTMRRLGQVIGVEAMALYRYFPSRRALFDAIVEFLVTDDISDPAVQLYRDDDWRDYLDRLGHGVRRIGLTHPRLFPLIATHPTQAPWLRPPLRSLRWVDTFLLGLQEHHFPPAAAATVYKQFAAFLLGHLLLETAGLGLGQEAGLAGLELPPPDTDQRGAADQRQRDADGAAEVSRGDGAPTAPEIMHASSPRQPTESENAGDEHVPALAEQREATVAPPDEVAVGDAVLSVGSLDLASYPHVAAMAGLLSRDTAATDFDRDLGRLLDQLASLRRP